MNLPHPQHPDESLEKLVTLCRQQLIELSSHVERGQRELLKPASHNDQVEILERIKKTIHRLTSMASRLRR